MCVLHLYSGRSNQRVNKAASAAVVSAMAIKWHVAIIMWLNSSLGRCFAKGDAVVPRLVLCKQWWHSGVGTSVSKRIIIIRRTYHCGNHWCGLLAMSQAGAATADELLCCQGPDVHGWQQNGL